jgi:hypothetical protein
LRLWTGRLVRRLARGWFGRHGCGIIAYRNNDGVHDHHDEHRN